VTGANGLLGRHVLKAFSAKHELHAMVREMPAEPIHGVTYYECNFKNDWSTEGLPNGIDTILHLVQSEKFRNFPNDALEVFNVNVASTIKLLDFAKINNVKKFIFTSTGGLYKTGIDSVTENTPINTFGTLGNYLASKFCSEILMHNYSSYFNVMVLRLFFMYGPGQNKSMLMPRLASSVKKKIPIKISLTGGIKINPIHVNDVVTIFERILDIDESLTLNVAGPEVLSIRDISEILGKAVGIEPIFEVVEKENSGLIANIDLLKNKLYSPCLTLDQRVNDVLLSIND